MAHNVLLTGSSGFIGAHVLQQLLNSTTPKFSVLAAVRSQSTIDTIASTYPSALSSGQLRFSIVPDITTPGAFDASFRNQEGFAVHSVVHVASPFVHKVNDVEKELLIPAIHGTTEILEGAARAGGVKRVVITSSFAAVGDFAAGGGWRTEYTYTVDDWNPATYEQAVAAGPENAGLAYLVSKTLAERAAWDFVKTRNPGFDVVTVNPPMVYGPTAPSHNITLSALGPSLQPIRDLISAPRIPPTPFAQMVDVRDVARAHVLALTTPSAGGHRFILCGGAPLYTDMVRYLKSPEGAQKLGVAAAQRTWPEESEESGTGGKEVARFDLSAARAVLGLEFTPWQDTVVDMVKNLIELGA